MKTKFIVKDRLNNSLGVFPTYKQAVEFTQTRGRYDWFISEISLK